MMVDRHLAFSCGLACSLAVCSTVAGALHRDTVAGEVRLEVHGGVVQNGEL